MAKENDKDVDDELEDDESDDSDTTDWKMETFKLREKRIKDRERTKAFKARIAELEAGSSESGRKEDKKPDEKLIERLDKMALQVAGITDADEVELFEKWKKDTGREADDIVGNSVFRKELENVRITKANLKATSEIQGGTGESGAKSTPDYWIAKATKGEDGKLRFPEETPQELYPKIVAKLGENEPGASAGKLSFYDK